MLKYKICCPFLNFVKNLRLIMGCFKTHKYIYLDQVNLWRDSINNKRDGQKRGLKFWIKIIGVINPDVPRETILSVLKNVNYAWVVGGLFSFKIRA